MGPIVDPISPWASQARGRRRKTKASRDKCVGRMFRYIRKRGVKCDAVAVDVRNHRDAHLAIVPLRLRGAVNNLVCTGGIEEKTY